MIKTFQSLLFLVSAFICNAQQSAGVYYKNDTMWMVKADGSTVQLTKNAPVIKTVNSVDLLGAGNIAIAGVNSTTIFLANDVVNNNAVANTLQDCTGLSFPVLANTTYRFKVFIVFNSIIATTGSRWSINGPATTFMFYRSNYTLTAASETVNSGITAYNNPSASNASSLTVGNIAIIEGIIRPSAVGTVIVRFASEISASAVTALGTGRSYIEFQAIN